MIFLNELCFLMILQGSVPTISIDNTSGCQLYLRKESLEASITTAKSSEINALVPDANSDGDWVSTQLTCSSGVCLVSRMRCSIIYPFPTFFV